MSTEELKLIITAENQASSELQEARNEVDALFGSTDNLGKKQVEVNRSGKDLAVGLAGVATSAWSLYQGYDNLIDSQVGVDKAMLAAKTSANAVEDAQTRYTTAVNKFGSDSPQATASLKDLQLAQERATISQERADMVQGNLSEAYTSFAIGVVPAVITGVASMSSVLKEFGGVTGLVQTAMSSLGTVFSFIAAHPILIVIGLIAGALYFAYQNCEPFRNAVNAIAQVLGGYLSNVLSAVTTAFTWLSTNVLPPLGSFLGGVFMTILNGLVSVFQFLGGVVNTGIGIFTGLWNLIKANPIIGALMGSIGMIIVIIQNWSTITQTLGNIWDGVMTAISNAYKTYVAPIVNLVTGFVNAIAGAFSFLFTAVVGGSSWTNMCKGISGLWNSVVGPLLGTVKSWASAIGGVFSGLASTLSGVWSGIVSAAQSAWSRVTSIASSASSAVSGIASGVGTAATNLYNSAASFVSGVASTVTKAVTPTYVPPTIPNPTTVKPPTVTTTSASQTYSWMGMATGFEGIINSPTIALIGESGAEMVNVKPLRSQPQSRVSGGGGGINVTMNFPNVLTLPENPETIRRIFYPALRQLQLDLARVR